MGFPDRITRVIALNHPRERVWQALSTPEGLSGWFGQRVSIDLRPGGAASMAWTDNPFEQTMRIERVEEPALLAWTWRIYGLPEADPRRTYVEFALEQTAEGTTLRLTESGFAQLADDEHAAALDGNTSGWAAELAELVEHLDAA